MKHLEHLVSFYPTSGMQSLQSVQEAVILDTSAAEEHIEERHSLLVSCEHCVPGVDVGHALLQDC